MINIRSLTYIVSITLFISFFPLKAGNFQMLDDNKWTVGLGTCLTTGALAGFLALSYSMKEQEILDREFPVELEKVKDDTYDLNNPVIQKLVPVDKGHYEKQYFKINWLNFYRKLHESNKQLSRELVSSYYKRTASSWISLAAGVAGLVLLFPALQEQKIIE